MKEKQQWKENEAPIVKWILALVVGIAASIAAIAALGGIAYLLVQTAQFSATGKYAIVGSYLQTILPFAGAFWMIIIFVKAFTRTSIRSLILGADVPKKSGKIKEVLPVIGLYLLGILVVNAFSFKNVVFSGKSAGTIVIIAILSILLVWMQTSWEELVFRVIPLRALCKNNLKPGVKALITALITSIAFMIMHGANPEITTMQGIDVVFMFLVYFAAGFLMALCDILDGSLLPGLIIHWVNNMFVFVFISGSVSAAGATSIWIDQSNLSGFMSLVTTVAAYIPVLIYFIIRYVKRKKAAANN